MSSPIGGFMPIPLAMMVPFMAFQSMMIGHGFGMSYQYGKRKISAMTNEEFNKLTPKILSEMTMKEFSLAIPDVKKAIADSQELQIFIIKELLEILPKGLLSLLGMSKKDIEEKIAAGEDTFGRVPKSPDFVTPPDKFINPDTGKQGTGLDQKEINSFKKLIDQQILNISNAIKKLVAENNSFKTKIYNKRTRRSDTAIKLSKRTQYKENLATIKKLQTELAKQKGYLADVIRGRKPF